jgi:multimeric flavodoxin WrbA
MNMRAVAFNGSPHKDGNTSILLKTVLMELEAGGVETEMVQVGALHGCAACEQCFSRKDGKCAHAYDNLNDCIFKMLRADAIIIGSPVYVGDVTASTRALIERSCMVSRANGNIFMRKIGAGVVAARRAGGTSALDSINHFLLAQGMAVAGSSYWNVAIGKDRGDVENDAEGMRTMKALGATMAWMLKGLKG